MPELPEVETIRRDLHARLCGTCILNVDVRHRDVVLGESADFVARVRGREITDTGRRGKVMWLRLGDDRAIAIHLRMSGRLLLVGGDRCRPPHTHLVFDCGADRALLYVDPRRFGRLEIVHPEDLDASVLLRNIGPDALSRDLDVGTLRAMARGRRIGIKEFLLDQRQISGIGNIYASEILHRVGLDPATPAGRLSRGEMKRVLEQARAVLTEAIHACGTTLADDGYRSALGRSGQFRRMLRVYDREGEPCRREGCGGQIERRVSRGRATYVCPRCQKSGGSRRPR